MSNHPNRSRLRDAPGRNPQPCEISRARVASGLTQIEAAALLFTGGRVWSQWETGLRRMHPAFWELFRIKTRRARGRAEGHRTSPGPENILPNVEKLPGT